MDLSLFSVAFDVTDVDVKTLPFPASCEPGKPLVVQFCALNINDALNYAKRFDGAIIGVHRIGPCILCGSLVSFE